MRYAGPVFCATLYIYMLHDTLDTVASALYVLASASQEIFGLGLIDKPV